MSETPRDTRNWFDRLLCAIGFHSADEPYGMHRWKCYDCGREWSE